MTLKEALLELNIVNTHAHFVLQFEDDMDEDEGYYGVYSVRMTGEEVHLEESNKVYGMWETKIVDEYLDKRIEDSTIYFLETSYTIYFVLEGSHD